MPLLFKDISFEDRSDPFHGCPTDDVTITPVRVEHPWMIDMSKIDVYTIKKWSTVLHRPVLSIDMLYRMWLKNNACLSFGAGKRYSISIFMECYAEITDLLTRDNGTVIPIYQICSPDKPVIVFSQKRICHLDITGDVLSRMDPLFRLYSG